MMKETVKAVIDKYGSRKIRYAFIPFGSLPSTNVKFTRDSPTRDDLKKLVNRLTQPSGDADLKKALEEAKNTFDSAPKRPNSEKVLVVIMDKKSINEQEKLKEVVTHLEDDGTKIVPVAVGTIADVRELERITENKGYLVKSPKDVDPGKLADMVMDKVLKGNYVTTFVV